MLEYVPTTQGKAMVCLSPWPPLHIHCSPSTLVNQSHFFLLLLNQLPKFTLLLHINPKKELPRQSSNSSYLIINHHAINKNLELAKINIIGSNKYSDFNSKRKLFAIFFS